MPKCCAGAVMEWPMMRRPMPPPTAPATLWARMTTRNMRTEYFLRRKHMRVTIGFSSAPEM